MIAVSQPSQAEPSCATGPKGSRYPPQAIWVRRTIMTEGVTLRLLPEGATQIPGDPGLIRFHSGNLGRRFVAETRYMSQAKTYELHYNDDGPPVEVVISRDRESCVVGVEGAGHMIRHPQERIWLEERDVNWSEYLDMGELCDDEH